MDTDITNTPEMEIGGKWGRYSGSFTWTGSRFSCRRNIISIPRSLQLNTYNMLFKKELMIYSYGYA